MERKPPSPINDHHIILWGTPTPKHKLGKGPGLGVLDRVQVNPLRVSKSQIVSDPVQSKVPGHWAIMFCKRKQRARAGNIRFIVWACTMKDDSIPYSAA
jgi:hypothetical protein